MTLKVILLAAGKGERFSSKGYTTEKPLLEYMGKPMLEHAILFAENVIMSGRMEGVYPEANVIVVGTPTACETANQYSSEIKTVVVEECQNGAAFSAYLASAYLKPDDRVLIVDTDNVYHDDDGEFAAYLWGESVPNSIMYATVPDTEYHKFLAEEEQTNGELRPILDGYSKYDSKREYPHLVNPKEISLSKNFVIGVYFFNKWQTFQYEFFNSAESFLIFKKEFSILELMSAVEPVCVEFPYEEWLPAGTPVQYEGMKNGQ